MIELINEYADLWLIYFGYSLAQNTVFLIVIFGVLLTFKNASAQMKYVISMLGIIKLLLPPFLPGSFLSGWLLEPQTTGLARVEVGDVVFGAGANTFIELPYPSILFLVWFVPFVLYLMTIFFSTLWLKLTLLKSSKKEPGGNYAGIQLLHSRKTSTLLTVGIFPKTIFLPPFWSSLPKACQHSLLQHEIAHIKRRDGFYQLLQNLVQALYFFHPLVWLLNERVNEYREMACDDAAIANSNLSPTEYSGYLVFLAENMVSPLWKHSSATALIRQKNQLLNRVNYLITEVAMQKVQKKKFGFILGVLVLLILPLSWYYAESKPVEAAETKVQQIATGKIYGHIKAQATGKLLPGVILRLKDTKFKAITDKKGNYFFVQVPPGKYILIAQKEGYSAIEIQSISVSVGKSTKKDLLLEKGGKIIKKEFTPKKVIPQVVSPPSPPPVTGEENKQKFTPKKVIAKEVSPPPPPTEQEFIPFDEPPVPVGGMKALNRRVVYPKIARRAGIEGEVKLKVYIDKQGKVTDVKVMQSLGKNGCDESAIRAVKSTKWKPAQKQGKPVSSWISVPVMFRLK